MVLKKRAIIRKHRTHTDEPEPTDRVKKWKSVTILHKGLI